jgi:hypothetical protein
MPVGWLLPIDQKILLSILVSPKPLLIDMHLVHLVMELDIASQAISGLVDFIGTEHEAG